MEITLKIEGMSCQHCVMSVKKAVDGVDGVKSSDVSIGGAKIVFDESRTDKDALVKAVEGSGYRVSG